MADSIDLNFNLTGPQSGGNAGNNDLISSLNSLGHKLTSFENTLSKFVTNTTTYSKAASVTATQAEAKLTAAKASEKRAEFNATDRGTAFRAKSLANSELNAQTRNMREQAISSLSAKSKESFERGDAKEGRRLQGLWENAISKGTQDGLKKGWGKIGGFGSLLYGGKLLANQISTNYALGGQIGIAAMSNPLTNNYDFGGPASRISQLTAQQHYGNVSLGLTAAGGAIGGLLGGPIGFGVGAGVGGALGQVFGAKGNAQAQMHAEALGTYINQRMANEALLGSNAAAGGLFTSAHGVMGNRFGVGRGDETTALDPTAPLAKEIAKGTAVYNRNYKEMDTLTKYAVAAQIPMSQLGKLGQTAGLLNLSKNEITNMANLASNYGVGLSDLAERTLVFQQGGLGKDTAMNAAAKSFQNVSGFQAQQTSFLQGGYVDREMRDIVGQIAGYDVEAINNPNHPRRAEAMAKLAKDQAAITKAPHGMAGIGSNFLKRYFLDISGFNQSTFNPNNPTQMDLNAGGATAAMQPSANLMSMLHLQESTSIAAKKGGEVDLKSITSHFEDFGRHLSGSSATITGFNESVVRATESLNELAGKKNNSSGLFVVHHKKHNSSGSTVSQIGR
jgi:hypothetical protein